MDDMYPVFFKKVRKTLNSKKMTMCLIEISSAMLEVSIKVSIKQYISNNNYTNQMKLKTQQ